MAETLRLTTVLEPRGPAAAVILTDEQVASFGAGKTLPVAVTVNGIRVQGRIARMGGENLIGFSKAARTTLGVAAGDTIEIEIALDDAPREVEIPPALAEALAAEPGAQAAFEKLSYTRRKEFARSVADAKKEETRTRRIEAVLAAVRP
ncbi:YdeI/OmpD-associated family protein [Gordonia sp. CPCC 205515]|uniref:YdeI/OmpD-associated family protein n=1 Tax=Gordonia sp. CPCC 205515 TaxID=3140791 RepID=UPI003AF371C3